jgi:hypothetical protein
MKTLRMTLLRAVAATGCYLSLGLLLADTNKEPVASTPADLVQAALKSELDGPSEARQNLLNQALKADPDFAPARWQLGFVRYEDRWLDLEEVAHRVKSDEKLTAYRKQRDAMVDTADSHKALARWCRKNKLVAEERIHWAKALEFDPSDGDALAGLGLQLHNGRLLTREQIEQAKVRAGEELQAMRYWQPRLVKWRKALDHGAPKQRDEAFRELGKLSDPAAIPALEAVFAENSDSIKSRHLNQVLIETVGRMREPEATEVLLRRAIVPDSQDIRGMAADQLKKRPMHAYVPQLIAALPGKLKTRYHIYVLPNGMVRHQHELFIEGRDFEISMQYESVVNPTDAWTAMFITPRAANRELLLANEIESRAELTDREIESARQRIQFVLKRTTGFANVDDPRLWEKQYNDYTERYELQPTQPKRVDLYAYNYESYTLPRYTPPSSPKSHVPTAGEQAAAAANEKAWLADYSKYYGRQYDPRHPSCFPAGTPIATIAGTSPIEKVKIGDCVLAQNPLTGELAYKPVQGVTRRPAVPLVEIGVGAETIRATRGHPFWVNGQGWLMAKQLQVGNFLHTVRGAVPIDQIGEAPAAEAYNLVVSDFDTYFVGEQQILVHDNLPLAETTALVPGLSQSDAD